MKAGKWTLLVLSSAFSLLLISCNEATTRSTAHPGVLRIATYNLQWFSEDANPRRISHIKSVIAHISPDIVALQEVESERALRQVFDGSWNIGVRDDKSDFQELAIAVKRPYLLVSSELVFTSRALEYAFPRGRDVLRCVVQSPDGKALVVYVVHMKSRRGGRLQTDSQRKSACGLLASYLTGRPEEHNAIVLGDFNDAPDDVSLNVLESGNLLASGGPNSRNQKLLVNVTEPLADRDFATEGVYRSPARNRQEAIVPGAKRENDRLRGQDYEFPRDVHIVQTMFDQILVNPDLATRCSRVGVYCAKDALEGSPGKTLVDGDRVTYAVKGDLASDHLPVWADFMSN